MSTIAPIVWTDVVDLAPQLNNVIISDGARTKILGYANELNACNYGGDTFRYKDARCYLAAHLGQLTLERGKNQVQSKTVGTTSVTVTYATFRSDTTKSGLALTPYGVQFDEFQQTSLGRVGFVL